jgi:hypothetical protein
MILIAKVNENSYHLSHDRPWALLPGTLALMTHFAEWRCPGGRSAMLAKLGARWSLLEGEARTSADRAVVRH